MATSDAPISIGFVSLIVKNIDKVRGFYCDVLGLDILSSSSTDCTLGRGDAVLLKLAEDKQARHYPQEAGLFHTAFVLPDRASLGSWVKHVHESKVAIDGAADHLVSEALYLTDPEGNGVEVYVDRDRSAWEVSNGQIKISTMPLDLVELASVSILDWDGMPMGSAIGHVHLQVGDIDTADSFYRDKIGFERTAGFERLGFYGSGGYHHHIGCNTWKSLGSKQKPLGATGIHGFELLINAPVLDPVEISDPWGVHVRLTPVND